MSWEDKLSELMDAETIMYLIVENGERLAVTPAILDKHDLDNGDIITTAKKRAILTMHEPEIAALIDALKRNYNR